MFPLAFPIQFVFPVRSESGTFVSISVFGTTSVSGTTSVLESQVRSDKVSLYSDVISLLVVIITVVFCDHRPLDANKRYPWFDLSQKAQGL